MTLGAQIGVKFGPGSQQPIFLDGVQCAGREQRLVDCSSQGGVNTHSCGHNHDAGVICQGDTMYDMDFYMLIEKVHAT